MNYGLILEDWVIDDIRKVTRIIKNLNESLPNNATYTDASADTKRALSLLMIEVDELKETVDFF